MPKKEVNKCIDCSKECYGKRCMGCLKKSRFLKIGKLEFSNKKELNLIIKMRLKQLPLNMEIEDKLLLEIINNLDPRTKDNPMCEFKKLKYLDWHHQTDEFAYARDIYRGGKLMTGLLKLNIGFGDSEEWVTTSAYHHMKTNENPKHRLNIFLRENWARNTRLKNPDEKCSVCSSSFGIQLHHKNIEFKEIAEKCLDFFSEKELREGVIDSKVYSIHDKEILNTHPAVKEMLRLHEDVEYEWLCPQHHKEEHHGK